MRLLFHSNILLVLSPYSETLCPGLCACLYPATGARSLMLPHCTDEPAETALECPYVRYLGPQTVNLGRMTRREYREYVDKYTWCYNPLALIPAKAEWRFFRCNALVASEKERHCG